MLQTSYAPIGGLKGTGFNSPQDMIDNIPFWKLVRKDEKIVAAVFYKDKQGRKSVAACTDGSKEGKTALASIKKEDFDRAYGEVSDRMLMFLKKNLPPEYFKKYVISYAQATKLSSDELRVPPKNDHEIQQHPDLADYFYQRKIGGEWHTKLMMGTPNKTIK
jgi:hypothetical protein